MKAFQIKGKFKSGVSWNKFTKTIESQNEKNALDKVYSIIGSNHSLKRNYIKIDGISEV
jgi:large subunit ribosomal protein LX